ncbi:hypothetical protein BDR06DRAFT_978170, partial [Suillus hirtellus]
GPKAVKYYDARTKQVKSSRDYRFLEEKPQKDTPDMQREGEWGEIDTPQSDDGGQTSKAGKSSVNLKRKREQDEIIPEETRRSTRTKIKHNYRVLNDPPEELAELVDDPDEEEVTSSAAEMIFAAFNESGIAPDDPKSLKEAKTSPDWSQWEKAVNTELEQLNTMGTWELGTNGF